MVGIARIGRPPKSGAQRKAEHDQRLKTLDRRACADPARRAHLEEHPEEWLKWYFPGTFYLPFSESHRTIINAVMDPNDMDVVVAAPRGEGKTNLFRALTLLLVVTKRSRFPVLGGWTGKAAKIGWMQWRMWLKSKRFADDYPEYAQPFQTSVNSTKLRSLRWSDTGEETGADIMALDLVIVLPDGLGVLAAGSLNGDIKGLNIPISNGEVLRPDRILLDDPQDVDRAGDPEFVEDTVQKIKSQWMGLAGPDSSIRMNAAVTIKEPDDVGETLGKEPGNIFIRVSRVVQFPDGFTDKNSECRAHWDRWYDLFSFPSTRKESFKYYADNKDVMTRNMRVSWEHRRDKKRGDPDAFFSAIADFYKVGEEAFWSEYQNQPLKNETKVYSITSELVQSRANNLPMHQVPDGSIIRVLGTDLNPSYGLTNTHMSFENNRRGHVMWNKVHTDKPLPLSASMSIDMRCAMLSQALFDLGEKIMGLPCVPEYWGIDASGEYFELVVDFASRFKGIPTFAMVGRAGKNYNPNVKSRIGIVRNGVYQCMERGKGKWLCFDADLMKETAQRAFLATPGAVGSVTLYDGFHREYATQMCKEVLLGKGDIGGRMIYNWQTLPGKHDYLDTTAMCYALAGWQGHGAMGSSAKQGRARKKITSGDMKARYGNG